MFTEEHLIYTYTRKQAIEDGFQFRLEGEQAEMARQIYKHPVYVTSGVLGLIEDAVNNEKAGNDFNGVLWDILWMSRANSMAINESWNSFEVIITTGRPKKIHNLYIECGPVDIDDPTPCLTVMLPEEH